MKKLLFPSSLTILLALSSCAKDSSTSNLKPTNSKVPSDQLLTDSFSSKAAWDGRNQPENMIYDHLKFTSQLVRKLDLLPKSGKLAEQPWSGDYWPTYKGGITYRWNDKKVSNDVEAYSYPLLKREEVAQKNIGSLSPAEKYDIFIGRYDFPLTKYERNRTKVLKTVPSMKEYDAKFEIPTWEGLCHAWAPATVLYKNPQAVTLEGANGVKVPFGAADVQALLTYFLHSNNKSRQAFLGGRCEADFGKLKEKLTAGEITKAEFSRIARSSDCADTNAGSFHIVLTNQIGLMKESFVVDVTRDAEVWNQAVYSYESRYLGSKMGASVGAAPGTVKEIEVETKMTYIVEVESAWEGKLFPESLTTVTYNYRLELNAYNEIIGGEWIELNDLPVNNDRPDFMWKQTAPQFPGSRDFFFGLKQIYEASTAKK